MASHHSDSSVKTDHNLNILVVEDDLFQRLLIFDLLGKYDYEVSLAANGKIAIQMLLQQEANYDLILLDYMMPEMDGLELLTFIKENPKLNHIPVIMMSSNGEEQSVAKCLEAGAKDYFVKPIRDQNLRQLAKYVDLSGREPSLLEYEILDLLGTGQSGSIYKVRSIEDNQFYALKKIELKNKNPTERKLAENEFILLKVLDSPTIIRYYKHFTRNETVHIIMEYAEGGSLHSLIEKHKRSGDEISNDQILDWIGQLVLGISIMHSKNILHRDIKPENMFLTKDNIVKLGDFGISKVLFDPESYAKTWCGTPYYMSPEVCNRNPYNQKSDIWSLGCSIYELAALKRPFSGQDLDDLTTNIREKEPNPLPSHVNQKIKMLVYLMMNKQLDKRPNILQLAQIDCVQERIVKFIQQHGLDMSLLPPRYFSKPSFPMNRLAEVAWNLRNSIELKTVNLGFFTKLKNVVSGEDLYKWFNTHIDFDYEEKIDTVINHMIQQELLFSPIGSKNFQISPNVYYQFQMDKPDIAANMTKIFKGQARQGLTVSKGLVQQMNRILGEVVERNKTGEIVIYNEKLKNSKAFVEFVEATSELQAIQLSSLQQDEKIACFLNIFQVMCVHKLLKQKSNEESKGGLTNKIKYLVKSDNTSFYYTISQLDFNLDDIMHGILRGNKKSPNAFYFKPFGNNDPRNKIVRVEDPRLIGPLHIEMEIPEKLTVFEFPKLDEQLDKYCKDYLDATLEFDPIDKTFTLPRVFRVYSNDFRSKEDLIRFVVKHARILNHEPQIDFLQDAEGFSITYYEKRT